MDFKLSRKLYLLIKFFIWTSYAFFLINFFSQEFENEVAVSVLLCAILIQMTIIGFLDNWFYEHRPTLLDWFRLTTFFIIVFNFLLLVKDLNHQDNFNGYLLKPENIVVSIFAVLVGLIGLKFTEILYVYFFARSNTHKYKEAQNEYDFRNPYLFFIFSLIIGFIQIFLMLTGEVGYGTFQENTTSDFSFLFQIVIILSELFLITFATFKYLYSYKIRFFNIVFISFFSIQIIYGFLSGMKESVIVPVIIVLIPYLLSGRKLPKSLLYIGILSLLLIYPLNNNYRNILNNYPNLDKGAALGIAFSKTTDFTFSENVSQGSEDFSGRLSLFPFLVYSVEKESEWTYYKNLDRYLYLPFSWIVPRFIIPDKPKSETGAVLNYQIFGYSTNSLTATTFGWAYLEGGLFYVFVLFLLFGFFISYFQYNLGFNSFFGLLLYVGILIDMLKVESDIYFIISGILQHMLIYFIFYNMIIKKIKSNKTGF